MTDDLCVVVLLAVVLSCSALQHGPVDQDDAPLWV